MPIDTETRRAAAREFAERLFVRPNATAQYSIDDLATAIGAIDDFMEGPASALNNAQTVMQNLNTALPPGFRGNATTQQKAAALALWAMHRAGMT